MRGLNINIFLDLDGVLADFIKGMANLFEKDYKYLTDNWKFASSKCEEVLGISREEFYDKIEEAGEAYWENLELFPHTMSLYNICKDIAPTYFLTKPIFHPSCVSGKLKWIYKHFGHGSQNYIFAIDKFLCARPGHILIDDLEKNVDKFREHGGSAILFPTITNIRYKERHNAFNIVIEELYEITKEVKI